MSLLNTLIANLSSIYDRAITAEEQQVEAFFPDMDVTDRIQIANEFRCWKSIIDTEKELTFEDFVKDISGDKKLKRKPMITDELIEKAKNSVGRTILKSADVL